ncbi:MAG: hypothetical protein ABIG28_02850 [archaeon]
MKKEDNSFGIAAVLLGILSIVFASANGVIFGIIGLIFANKQQKVSKNKWGKNGKILSIIGIILSIILIIILIVKPELLAMSQYDALT